MCKFVLFSIFICCNCLFTQSLEAAEKIKIIKQVQEYSTTIHPSKIVINEKKIKQKAKTKKEKQEDLSKVYKTKTELEKDFPNLNKKHSTKFLTFVDFSKHMVVCIRKSIVHSRPLGLRVGKISSTAAEVTIDWHIRPVAQGIAPPPATLKTVTGYYVITKSDLKMNFKYSGVIAQKFGINNPPPPSSNFGTPRAPKRVLKKN